MPEILGHAVVGVLLREGSKISDYISDLNLWILLKGKQIKYLRMAIVTSCLVQSHVGQIELF